MKHTRTMLSPTKKKKPSKVAVEEMITNGAAKTKEPKLNSRQMGEVLSEALAPAIAVESALEKPKRTTAKPGYKQINIPLLESEIEQINVLRKLRPIPRGSNKDFAISLQNWIVEAVAEKLGRDNDANNITTPA